MIFLLITIIASLGTLLFFSVKKNFELMSILDDVSDQVEESLDIIDNSYRKISEKASLEVMSDEPVVRELIADIQTSKDALILVANKIVQPLNNDDLDDQER